MQHLVDNRARLGEFLRISHGAGGFTKLVFILEYSVLFVCLFVLSFLFVRIPPRAAGGSNYLLLVAPCVLAL